MALSVYLPLGLVCAGILNYVSTLLNVIYELKRRTVMRKTVYALNQIGNESANVKQSSRENLCYEKDLRSVGTSDLGNANRILTLDFCNFNSPEKTVFVTPIPILSIFLFLSLIGSLVLSLLQSSQSFSLVFVQQTSLYAGFSIALLVEILERIKILPERSTIVAICFSMINELVLVFSESFESRGISDEITALQPVHARMHQFTLISIVANIAIGCAFALRPTVGLKIAVSYALCIHGGMWGLELMQSSNQSLHFKNPAATANEVMKAHFLFSELLFGFFILFFVFYLLAYRQGRQELRNNRNSNTLKILQQAKPAPESLQKTRARVPSQQTKISDKRFEDVNFIQLPNTSSITSIV